MRKGKEQVVKVSRSLENSGMRLRDSAIYIVWSGKYITAGMLYATAS
jgi:hypothetical protein